MSILPTVRVKGGSKGSRIINASDFDPKVHQLADPPARHPLDHDGDGHKGGSLPDVEPAPEPADDNSESFTDPHGTHEAAPAPAKPKAKRRKAKGRK